MTVLVPTGKIAGALLVTATTPQLSATVGLPRATLVAPHIPGEAKTVTSVGQEIRSEEHTAEIQVHLNIVCRLLVAQKVQMTVLVPTGKIAGALLVTVTVPQL